MPNHFDALPSDTDLQAICAAVRDIVRDLHQTAKRTYPEISKAATDLLARPALQPSAIKVFLEKETTRINSNNRALPILYDYIRSGFHNFPASTREKALQHWSTLVPDSASGPAALAVESEKERSLGLMFKNWLNVTDHEINKLSAKMFGDFSGDYVLLRKSVVDPNMVVKSRLRIDRAHGRDALPKARHFHHDRQNIERVSTGVFLPLVSNVYGILEVENGEGLEFIALRNPIQWNFQKMMGFMTSMNMDRNILSARIFIERDGTLWDGIGPRFTREEVKENEYISNKFSLLDEGKSLTIPDI
jgi:hypothetical protein